MRATKENMPNTSLKKKKSNKEKIMNIKASLFPLLTFSVFFIQMSSTI